MLGITFEEWFIENFLSDFSVWIITVLFASLVILFRYVWSRLNFRNTFLSLLHIKKASNGENWKTIKEKFNEIKHGYVEHTIELPDSTRLQFKEWYKKIEKTDGYYFVLGESGVGKTALMHKLALKFSSDFSDHIREFFNFKKNGLSIYTKVFYIRAIMYATLDLMQKKIDKIDEEAHGVNNVLLIDGFDELRDMSNYKDDESNLIEIFDKLCTLEKFGIIIITSREEVISNIENITSYAFNGKHFQIHKIEKFNSKQVIELYKKQKNKSRNEKSYLPQLEQLLKENPNDSIFCYPFLIKLADVIFEAFSIDEIKSFSLLNLYKVYDAIVKKWIEREYDILKSCGSFTMDKNIFINKMLGFAQEVAVQLGKHQAFKVNDINSLLKKYVEDKDGIAEITLLSRNYFVLANDKYEFKHRTLFEFFLAKHLIEKAQYKDIYCHLEDKTKVGYKSLLQSAFYEYIEFNKVKCFLASVDKFVYGNETLTMDLFSQTTKESEKRGFIEKLLNADVLYLKDDIDDLETAFVYAYSCKKVILLESEFTEEKLCDYYIDTEKDEEDKYWLDLSNSKAKDLSIIKHFKNIKSLDISDSQIEDLSALKGYEIKRLDCLNCKIAEKQFAGLSIENIWLSVHSESDIDLAISQTICRGVLKLNKIMLNLNYIGVGYKKLLKSIEEDARYDIIGVTNNDIWNQYCEKFRGDSGISLLLSTKEDSAVNVLFDLFQIEKKNKYVFNNAEDGKYLLFLERYFSRFHRSKISHDELLTIKPQWKKLLIDVARYCDNEENNIQNSHIFDVAWCMGFCFYWYDEDRGSYISSFYNLVPRIWIEYIHAGEIIEKNEKIGSFLELLFKLKLSALYYPAEFVFQNINNCYMPILWGFVKKCLLSGIDIFLPFNNAEKGFWNLYPFRSQVPKDSKNYELKIDGLDLEKSLFNFTLKNKTDKLIGVYWICACKNNNVVLTNNPIIMHSICQPNTTIQGSYSCICLYCIQGIGLKPNIIDKNELNNLNTKISHFAYEINEEEELNRFNKKYGTSIASLLREDNYMLSSNCEMIKVEG